MAYRVELATTRRATCKNTECQKQAVKIDKGELRLGVWVTYKDQQSWAWRHWGCVTPAQIGNLGDALEGDIEMLDGYEELPEDCQQKVKRAIDQGHVDDEDWKGDLEQNRPGKRGFRSPAAKKKKKVVEANEESDVQQGDRSPSKSAPKKRGRGKKEGIENDEIEEPVRKKTKAAGKKAKKIKDEGENNDEPNTDASKSTSKNVPMIKDEEEEEAQIADEPDTDAIKPSAKKGKAARERNVTKASAKKSKAAKEEAGAAESDTVATAPKKTKAVNRKGKKVSTEEESKDLEAPIRPAKAARQHRKAPVDYTEGQDSAGEQAEAPAKNDKKARATKNTANSKKAMAKKDLNTVEAAEESAIAEAPKKKRGGKKAGG